MSSTSEIAHYYGGKGISFADSFPSNRAQFMAVDPRWIFSRGFDGTEHPLPVLSRMFGGVALVIWCLRMYVDVHFPFDVLAGIVIGMLAAGMVLGVSDLVLHWT